MRSTIMMASVAVLATATVTGAAEAAGEARVQRLEEYNTRRLESIRKLAASEKEKAKEAGGNIKVATAMLYLEQDIEEANRIIVEADMVKLYWSAKSHLIPPFLMFNADTGSRKKLLTREATDKILDYLPPELAYDIWANPDKRGSFSYRERLTQFSPKVDQPSHVYKYSYVTPEYILGSLIGHVSNGKGGYVKTHKKGQIMGHYHERSMVGITLGTSRSILRLCPIIPFRGYHAMQNGPVLLARWYGRETKGGQH